MSKKTENMMAGIIKNAWNDRDDPFSDASVYGSTDDRSVEPEPLVEKDDDEEEIEIDFKSLKISDEMLDEYMLAVRYIINEMSSLFEKDMTFDELVKTHLQHLLSSENPKLSTIKNLQKLETKKDDAAKTLQNLKEKIAKEKATITRFAAEYNKKKKSDLNEKLSDEDLREYIRKPRVQLKLNSQIDANLLKTHRF